MTCPHRLPRGPAVGVLHNATKESTVVAKEATIMPILHVRGISEDLHGRIKRQAMLEHRSFTAEVIHLLEQGLDAERTQPSMAEVLERARLLRESLENKGLQVDSTEILRQERERRTRQLLGE
jgi:plasmid stability protein